MAGKANFSVVKGDTFIRNCTFRNKGSQTPVNLSGSEITGKVGDMALTCSVTNAVQGKFSFSLTPTQTEKLSKINKIEIQVVYPDSTIQTLFSGNLVTEEQLV